MVHCTWVVTMKLETPWAEGATGVEGSSASLSTINSNALWRSCQPCDEASCQMKLLADDITTNQ